MSNTFKPIKIGQVTMQAGPWKLEQNYLRLVMSSHIGSMFGL